MLCWYSVNSYIPYSVGSQLLQALSYFCILFDNAYMFCAVLVKRTFHNWDMSAGFKIVPVISDRLLPPIVPWSTHPFSVIWFQLQGICIYANTCYWITFALCYDFDYDFSSLVFIVLAYWYDMFCFSPPQIVLVDCAISRVIEMLVCVCPIYVRSLYS